jgi:hypothetical protein
VGKTAEVVIKEGVPELVAEIVAVDPLFSLQAFRSNIKNRPSTKQALSRPCSTALFIIAPPLILFFIPTFAANPHYFKRQPKDQSTSCLQPAYNQS